MQEKIGYKVLNSRRRSCMRFIQEGGVYYKKDKKVTPKEYCGPLCVFDTLQNAVSFKEFYSNYYGQHIVKCNYVKSKITKIYVSSGFCTQLVQLPIGTILADSVTCLE